MANAAHLKNEQTTKPMTMAITITVACKSPLDASIFNASVINCGALSPPQAERPLDNHEPNCLTLDHEIAEFL